MNTMRQQYTYNVTFSHVRAMIVALKKQLILHILSVFVYLGIQHAMHMRHIVIFGLPDSAIYFHIIVNGTIFGGKKVLNIKCVLISSATFV